MTDRELLEMAAKAAGIALRPMEINVSGQGDNRFIGYTVNHEKFSIVFFDPLKDDGDAFRLAARLGIDLLFNPEYVEAVATQHAREEDQEMVSPWARESRTLKEQTPEAATRRAIVRVAAEIGKAMP